MTLISFLVTWVAAITPVNVRVDGDGYLRLMRDGRAVYAKLATLTALPDGRLGTTAGDPVLPSITVPAGASALRVDLEGNVSAGAGPIGRLVLAIFPANSALSEKGGVLLATDRPKLGNPGEGPNGVIRTDAGSIASNGSAPIKTAAPVAVTGKVRITANASAEVAGDVVKLGDIATIEAAEPLRSTLAQVDLGEAPAFGLRRVFDRLRISTRLRSAGVAPDSIELIVPTAINVTRQGQSIPQSAFIETALKTVALSGIEYTSDDVAPEFKAPLGEVRLVSEGVAGLNTAACSVKIAVFVDGKRINSRTIKLTATVLPASIKSGESVKVRFLAGGAVIELTGIARSAGKIGDQISVEVRPEGADKSVHLARVIGAGVVEVKL